MSQQPVTRSASFKLVRAQVSPATPDTIIELMARQLDRADDARTRIESEGTVVRDVKGSVVEHPALAIERAATKLYVELAAKYVRKPGDFSDEELERIGKG